MDQPPLLELPIPLLIGILERVSIKDLLRLRSACSFLRIIAAALVYTLHDAGEHGIVPSSWDTFPEATRLWITEPDSKKLGDRSYYDALLRAVSSLHPRLDFIGVDVSPKPYTKEQSLILAQAMARSLGPDPRLKSFLSSAFITSSAAELLVRACQQVSCLSLCVRDDENQSRTVSPAYWKPLYATTLKTLDLCNISTTSTLHLDLASLSRIPNLEELQVCGATVTNTDNIASLMDLKCLCMFDCKAAPPSHTSPTHILGMSHLAPLKQLTKLVLATSTKIGSDAWPLIASLPSLSHATISHVTIGASPAPSLTFLKAALLLVEREDGDLCTPISLSTSLPQLQQLHVHVAASHYDIARALHGHQHLSSITVQQEAVAVLLQHAQEQQQFDQQVLHHAAQIMLQMTSITVQAVPVGGQEEVIIQQAQQQQPQQQPAAGAPAADAAGIQQQAQPAAQELVLGPQAPAALQALLNLAQFDLAQQQAQQQLAQQQAAAQQQIQQQIAALQLLQDDEDEQQMLADEHDHQQQEQQQPATSYWPEAHYSSLPKLQQLHLSGLSCSSLDAVLADAAGCSSLQELSLSAVRSTGSSCCSAVVSSQGLMSLRRASSLRKVTVSNSSVTLEELGGLLEEAAGKLEVVKVSEVLVMMPAEQDDAGDGGFRMGGGDDALDDAADDDDQRFGTGNKMDLAPAGMLGDDGKLDAVQEDDDADDVMLALDQEVFVAGKRQSKVSAVALTAAEQSSSGMIETRLQGVMQSFAQRFSGSVQKVEYAVKDMGGQQCKVEIVIRIGSRAEMKDDGVLVPVVCLPASK